MRRLSVISLICRLACVAISTAREAVVDAFDRFVRFVFAWPPEPMLALETGDDIRPSQIFAFGDPHVARHEAGMSRRAAARGI